MAVTVSMLVTQMAKIRKGAKRLDAGAVFSFTITFRNIMISACSRIKDTTMGYSIEYRVFMQEKYCKPGIRRYSA